MALKSNGLNICAFPTPNERVYRNMDTYLLTLHARLRLSQRSLSDADIGILLAFGRIFNTADGLIYFLDRTNIPDCDPQESERLRGTAVNVALLKPCRETKL